MTAATPPETDIFPAANGFGTEGDHRLHVGEADARGRALVARLRYEVYVEEMGRDEPNADHAGRQVCDPDDTCGHLLMAREGECQKAVGTVRLQRSKTLSDFDRDFHGIATLPAELDDCAGLTSKFMTSAVYRRGILPKMLMLAVFECGLRHGHRLNFINCNRPLDKLFARFGFRQLGERRQHPLYGDVAVMVLPISDLSFLRSIRSPFVPILERLGEDEDATAMVREWAAGQGLQYWEENAEPRQK
ncbi:MAG: GNAT family N-acyltransferase [Planctomycetota bacterium]